MLSRITEMLRTCAVICLLTSPTFGGFSFHKVADTTRNVTSAQGPVEWFDLPFYDGTSVVIPGGTAQQQRGLYIWSGKDALTTAVELGTPVPGTASTFTKISF